MSEPTCSCFQKWGDSIRQDVLTLCAEVSMLTEEMTSMQCEQARMYTAAAAITEVLNLLVTEHSDSAVTTFDNLWMQLRPLIHHRVEMMMMALREASENRQQ